MEVSASLWVIPCTYDGISSPVHIQNFPTEGPVRIVTIINTKSLGQPVFTSPTGYLTPNSPSGLWPPARSTRVPPPWWRLFVLDNWLEHPMQMLCWAGLQGRRVSTAKWKCSTSHRTQTGSIAGCRFAEGNVRPAKYRSRSLPADSDNQNATRYPLHSSVKWKL